MVIINEFWASIRSFIGMTDNTPETIQYTAIKPKLDARLLQDQSQFRQWSSSISDADEVFRIGTKAVHYFDTLPASWLNSMNEETTKTNLINPMLNALGWTPLNCEVALSSGGKADYYDAKRNTAIEAKAAKALYDDIAALNPTSAYKNIAQQAVTYLDSEEVGSVIYTNGRFWWRLERDCQSNRLFALRFNLNLAQNMIRNHGRYDPLKHFTGLFHATAYNPYGNHYTVIHPGRSIDYGPVGAIMVKDLNNGLGS